MTHLNVQSDLIGYLRSKLPKACSVGVSVPAKATPPYVTVRREGGRYLDRLRDRAGLGVYVWAKSELEASELADEVAGYMAELAFSAGYDDISMESMRSDPDPDSRYPRWYLSYSIICHKQPKE